jgi:hypothetical protein
MALKGAQDPAKSYTQLRAASSTGRLADMGAGFAALAKQLSAEGSDDPEVAVELSSSYGRQGHHAWRQRGSKA